MPIKAKIGCEKATRAVSPMTTYYGTTHTKLALKQDAQRLVKGPTGDTYLRANPLPSGRSERSLQK